MSRLFDRILAAGCPRFRVAELFRSSEGLQAALGRVAERNEPGTAQTLGLSERQLGQFLINQRDPVGTAQLVPEDLLGAPVIAADNVADYCASLPPEQALADLVTTLAPPFSRFFVECAPSRPSDTALAPHAWGFLCGGADLTQDEWREKVPDRRLAQVLSSFAGAETDLPDILGEVPVRWMLQLVLFLEFRKGHPMGPVAEHTFPLDDGGHLIALQGGEVISLASMVGLSTPLLQDLEGALLDQFDAQLLPALLGISLMHCRNVRLEQADVPTALSRRAVRRSGRPLVRYQVIDIAPMRRILDEEGGARTKGLGQALHICRGHFKTFTTDAPLFGRHTGTYWWHDSARGSPKRGRITTTDYRITQDQLPHAT